MGRRALARLGARMALVYVVATAGGVIAGAVGPRAPWAGLPVAAQVLVVGLIATAALAATAATPQRALPAAPRLVAVLGRPAVLRLALRLVAVLAGLALVDRVVAAGPLLDASELHAVVGIAIAGVGLALGLAAGPTWGGAAFAVAGAGFALRAPSDAAAAVPATLAGAAVTVVAGAVIHVGARRGHTQTEAETEAAEAAEIARLRAERNLAARRRADRVLHDTVLATLTVLAHAARGVSPELVRRDCRRDLAALRGDRWSAPVDQGAGTGGGTGHGQGAGVGERTGLGRAAGLLPRQAAPLAERLAAVQDLAARRGLDLRVHLESVDPEACERTAHHSDVINLAALEAWSHALSECVTNISRHAGVTAADVVLGHTDDLLVTLVVDEGAGFAPDAVRPERLGLSGSVTERLQDVGGRARVWSRPGEGTVVELLLPWPRVGVGDLPGGVSGGTS